MIKDSGFNSTKELSIFINKQESFVFYPFIHFLLFCFLIFFPTSSVLAEMDNNNNFSLWAGPSEIGESYMKIRGYCQKTNKIVYYSMHIVGYEDKKLIEEKKSLPRRIPEFNILVNAKRHYELTMYVQDDQNTVINTSETLKIAGNYFIGYQKTKHSNSENLFQQRLRTRTTSGITVTFEEIQLDSFPYINVLLTITKDGQQLNGLTANNFIIRENNLAPSVSIEVVPPQESSVRRIADFAFVFDHSGSMNDDLQRLRDSMGAFISYLEQSNVVYNVAFIPYEITPIIYQSLTSNLETFLSKVDEFLLNWPGGGTENAFLAIQKALSDLSWRPGAQKTILLFTDEDDDYGGPSLSIINQQLIDAQATVYPIIDESSGHSGRDYCDTGSIASSTGGRCYDIYNPTYNNVLDDISQTVADKYIIKYKTPSPDVQDVLRTISIYIITDDGNVSASKEYDLSDGNTITTSLLPETENLSTKPQRKNKAIPIYCKITSTDPSKHLSAYLFYKNNTTSYKSIQLSSLGSDQYLGSILPAEVLDPYVYYYISVSDGIQTVTLPTSEASQNPFVITILPNIPPKITHAPIASTLEGDPITIEAMIEDATMEVTDALIKYRTKGDILYKSIFMTELGNSMYEATIPGEDVVTPGIEYLIYAVDDYASSSTYGTDDSPIEIFVHATPSIPTEYIDFGKLRIWGDQFSGDYSGNQCQGNCTVSGNVKIGVLAGTITDPLISIDSYIELSSSTNTITNKGNSNITALQMKRNTLKTPEDIQIWYGTIEIDASKPALKCLSGQSKFKFGIHFMFQRDNEISMSDNMLVFHDIYTEISNFINLPITFSEIILDQEGSHSTGYVKLSLEQILGITNSPHSGCCSYHGGVKGCAGFMKKCKDGSLSGCGCVGIGNAYLSDLEFEWDFVKEGFYLKGNLDFPNGLKISGAGTSFGFLYNPVRLDRIGLDVSKEGLVPFTIPPGALGFQPNSIHFLLDNLSQGFSNASYDIHFSGPLRDKTMILKLLNRNVHVELMEASLGGKVNLNDIAIEIKGSLKMLNGLLNVGDASIKYADSNFTIQGKMNLVDILVANILLDPTYTPAYNCEHCILMNSDLSITLQFPQYMEDLPKIGSYVAGKTITGMEGTLNVDACLCNGLPSLKKTEIATELSISNFFKFGLRFDVSPPFGSINIFSSTSFLKKEYAPRLWVKGYALGYAKDFQIFRRKRSSQDVVVHAVEVISNQNVLLIVVNSEYSAAFFEITCPDGSTYLPENCPPQPDSPFFETAIFMRNENANEAYYALNNASAGTYSVTILNTNELGSYSIEVMEQNKKPDISVSEPSGKISVNPGDSVTISWTAEDLDDNADICLFYDSDNSGLDGKLITCDFKEDDPVNYSNWTIPSDIYGSVYIYAKIDDGNWAPVSAYSSGKFLLPEEPKPSTPAGITITTGDGSLQVSWTLNDSLEDVTSYKVYLKDDEEIFTFIVNSPPFELDNLANDRTYEISLSAINSDAAESEKSQFYEAVPVGSSQDGPPDLTVDANADFSLTQVVITVRNISDFKAYAYKVTCYYGMIENSSLFETSSEGELEGQSFKDIVFPWQLPENVSYCESQQLYCQISDVYINELNENNNITAIENSLEEITKAVSVNLYQGWNLFSMPYEPENSSIETVLDSIMEQVKSVWSYDNNRWYMYYPQQPGFNDLFEIHSGKGYWIYMSEDASLCSSAQTISEISFVKGWNLFGISGKSELLISDALTSIEEKYISLWVYINGEWDVFDPENPGFTNSLTTIKPGLGYWINTKEACQLVLP